jgi:hypothetical protein
VIVGAITPSGYSNALPAVILAAVFGGAIVSAFVLDTVIVAVRWPTTCCD